MPGDDSALMEVKRKIQKEAMRQAYYEHLVRAIVHKASGISFYYCDLFLQQQQKLGPRMRLRQRVMEGHPLDPARQRAAREQPELWATSNIPRNLNSYEALHKPVSDAKQRLEIEKNYVSDVTLLCCHNKDVYGKFTNVCCVGAAHRSDGARRATPARDGRSVQDATAVARRRLRAISGETAADEEGHEEGLPGAPRECH